MFISLQGWRRKVLFVVSFEVMAISCSSLGLSLMSEQSVSHASVMGAACSAIAVAWNWIFNSMFEKWESHQASIHRTLLRRVAHALGFEIPLLVGFVLLFSWWFSIGFVQALLMDLALFLFFLVFTFLYTWGFDLMFGQPNVLVREKGEEAL
ncbi:MAG: PACE efflux transporter [Betaproteobacteria bacterium]